MGEIAELFVLVWFRLALLWILTFVGPTRRAMARAVLARHHIPLRYARWALGLSAITVFLVTEILGPSNDSQKSGPQAVNRTERSIAQVSHDTEIPEGWVVITKGKWTMMSFAHTGSEAERNVGLDETRREVFGYAEDSTYDSRSECEEELRKVQAQPSPLDLLNKYQPEADRKDLIFVRLRKAEIGHHAIAEILGDVTSELGYGLGRGTMIRSDDLAPFFRIEPSSTLC